MTMITDHLDASQPGMPPMESERPPENPTRRLVIVVRADPVICGHSGEARNLAEAALTRGFDDIRIVTWPLDTLQAAGLPLKPLHSVLPYSPGITVERPEPIGDYKIPDGRNIGGIVGRLVELFTEGVPTVAMSLYLTPHDTAVSQAAQIAKATGMCAPLTTSAEAVGSDITNIVRSAVTEGRFGAAAQVLTTYLSNDVCVAVSEFTRDLIVEAAQSIDDRWGTSFAPACTERIKISYPAINASAFTELNANDTDRALAARGLERDGYVLFLSRLSRAKGVDDLINGFAASAAQCHSKLVICGNGPEAAELRALAASTPHPERIVFFDDVDDAEKPHLMAGCSAYVLASKPRTEFVETFGIALAEKMLAGGGPVITCDTGGIGEAVGPHARIVPPGHPAAIANTLSEVILGLSSGERTREGAMARRYAMQFDRANVFAALIAHAASTAAVAAA